MKVVLILLIGFTVFSYADDGMKEVDLQGAWNFKTGDDQEYAASDFNDTDWDRIHVPSRWEDEGYKDYNGYAWYRKAFTLPIHLKNEDLALRLGQIDDVDQVYLNGEPLQGRGSFPPEYDSAFREERCYQLPNHRLKFGGENVIAVRVYDDRGGGGIRGKKVGIYVSHPIRLEIDLDGKWAFTLDDDQDYAKPEFQDADWQTIRVPSYWKSPSKGSDQCAWYRQTVKIPSQLKSDKLVLALGRVDDSDEVFLNGIRIGKTGALPEEYENKTVDSKIKQRFYYIPRHIIRWDQPNTIAVRVYNWNGVGGIYEGPVGIATQKALIEYKSTE